MHNTLLIERIVKTDISLIMSVDIIKVIESASRTKQRGLQRKFDFFSVEINFCKIESLLIEGFPLVDSTQVKM